jgi:hypothetical protein
LLKQFDTVFSVTRATNEQVCRLCAIRHPEKIAARTLRSKRLHSADTSVPATPQNEQQQQQQQQKFPQQIEGRKKNENLLSARRIEGKEKLISAISTAKSNDERKKNKFLLMSSFFTIMHCNNRKRANLFALFLSAYVSSIFQLFIPNSNNRFPV